jgi:poly(A) polymerase
LRAVRFAAQLGFEIEPKTFAAVRALAPKIGLISAERIRDELIKLFRPPHAGRGLVLLRDSELLPGVLPEFTATIVCEQSPDFHPEGTVFEHTRLMLEKMPPDAPESLPWAVLLHDIAKPATAERDPVTDKIHFYGHEKTGALLAERILTRLRFPKRQIVEIMACVRQHMQFKDVKQMRKATLRRLLLRETFPLELELHRLDCLGSHGDLGHYEFLVEQAAELEKRPAIRPPLLTGDDLIALGVKPGPAMGAMLAEIREKQLQDELKTPRQARAWVKKQLLAHG